MWTKPRYVPDLRKFIGNCESNYHRLLRLLPGMDEEDRWVFGAENGGRDELTQVRVRVLERSKYTTTLSLLQEPTQVECLPGILMTVRLYHDARVAEVLSFQRNRHIRQTYDYPNKKLYQRDEKAQLNLFLGEWLAFCLKTGCSVAVSAAKG